MRVLLGSGGFRTPERVAFLAEEMRRFFGAAGKLLFVPYALRDHDGYVKAMVERGIHAGYELDGVHRHADPRQAVREASALFVGGGNTFRLLADLYRHGLIEVIRERVRAGVPYLGISAGSNVACPTIKTTNDMPIVMPPSFDALGLVPFQVNPHYFTGQTHVKREDGYQEHFGETRDERLREFHEMNDTPVVGLWEAGLLHVEGGQVRLSGAPARLFRKGRDPVDVPAGARLDDLLGLGAVSYTVAAEFEDAAVAAEWLAWLAGGHVAEVMAGGATGAEVVALDGPRQSFEVRYRFPSREAFARYEQEHAPRLRAEGLRLFGAERGVRYRRSVGVVAQAHPELPARP
jgi:dipeptidase E